MLSEEEDNDDDDLDEDEELIYPEDIQEKVSNLKDREYDQKKFDLKLADLKIKQLQEQNLSLRSQIRELESRNKALELLIVYNSNNKTCTASTTSYNQ